FGPILVVTWPIFLLAIVRWVYGLGCLLIKRNANEVRVDFLLTGWLLFSFWGVATGGYFREHYFVQIIPPLALLAAAGADRIAGRPAVRLRPNALLYGLVAAAIAYGVYSESWYFLPGPIEAKCRRRYLANPFPESPAIGRYIADHSDSTEQVLIIGTEPQILFYADRKSASRFILTYPLFGVSKGKRERQERVIDDLRQNRPKFVVTVYLRASLGSVSPDDQKFFDTLEEILRASYQIVLAMP